MKKTNRVALNIRGVSDEALMARVMSIIESMTDNANFPAPLPELDAMKTAATLYEKALAVQHPGSREDTFRKNDAREALEYAYRMLGSLVDMKSISDLGMLLSSGFDARKSPSPVGRLERPAFIQIELTRKPGSVKVITAKVNGASSYLFQYAVVPVADETQWRTIGGTARTKIIDNLEPGKQYAFRVAGVGADPSVAFSDVVIRFVA